MAGDTLPGSLRRMLAVMDRFGAHDPLVAVHAGQVARATDQNLETVKHLLNRLYSHGLLGRAEPDSGPPGWVYWLSVQGLNEARKTIPAPRIEQPQRPPEARTQREGYEV